MHAERVTARRWGCRKNLRPCTLSSSKNAQIELLDRQLVDYRDKLKGASPDEARAKIDALESTIRLMIGSKWKPLTKEESDRLRTAVASLPKRRILAQG